MLHVYSIPALLNIIVLLHNSVSQYSVIRLRVGRPWFYSRKRTGISSSGYQEPQPRG